MKKLFILFTIILLSFSTIVIAEEDNTREADKEGPSIALPPDLKDNPTVRKRYGEALDLARDKTKEAKSLVRDGKVVARKVTKQVREAKQRVATARERYANAKQDYVSKKQELSNLKERYRECLNSDTEDCKRENKQTRLKAKEHLQNSANLVLRHLEELKERILSSEDLTQEEVDEHVSNIDERILEVEEAKATLDTINEDTSREEVKEAAGTIKEAWNKVKLHSHKIKLKHFGARFRNLIAKAEIFGERAKEKANEVDSERLDALIEDYMSKVERAKEQHKLAKEKWEEASTPREMDEAVKVSHRHFRAINDYLKEAREKLREIMSELRSNDKEISLDIEEEDEE